MIRFLIAAAKIQKQADGQWHVVHPSNSAVLAVASTAAEAVRAVGAIDDMVRQLRAAGEKVCG
jgi:predicted RNase H-like HicB family nuclease